ncbi:amidohydrolase family protein [Pseudonocardia sp. H11422]|uniref:amidohydrolase family protein n=1 Tax=Pseudonocardia sp. H11422 TaxID=2835866 RepID=UPI001BDD2615|nr:amidohydrolase family protein [Pseudonocardia sp. H11422]
MDLANVVAIDVHTHAVLDTNQEDEASKKLREAADKHFGNEEKPPSLDETAAHYRERNMMFVVFPVHSEAGTGRVPMANEKVLEAAQAHPDVAIPFVSVDPWKGKAAIAEVKRLVEEYPVRGFKFQPCTQAFQTNDHRFFPLYEAMAETGLPVLFHTGQTGIGAGLPGGGDIRLKYGNPMFLDDVAAEFPEMTIIMAHPAFPWQDEALAVCLHKGNVYIDLSGWSPKYFPPQLIQYSNSLLKHKVLFGTDYPSITPDRWMKDFESAGFKDEVKPLIFKENAIKALKLQ